jgi:hypothetical protein
MTDLQKFFTFRPLKNRIKSVFATAYNYFQKILFFRSNACPLLSKNGQKRPWSYLLFYPSYHFSLFWAPQTVKNRKTMSATMSDVRKKCPQILPIFGDFFVHKSSIKYPLNAF